MQKNEHKNKVNNDDSSVPKYPDTSHMKHLD